MRPARAVAHHEAGARNASGPGPLPTPPSIVLDEETEVRVELGRSLVRDGLKLGQIVSLDRLAGESVDLYIDGQLVARGEIVSSGEALAVRVTQVVVTRRASSRSIQSGPGGRIT
jgi:flagellar motor switch protein FliN/FliY